MIASITAPLKIVDFVHPSGEVVGATITGGEEFQALKAAERWCIERGISYGSMQRGKPTGLLAGNFQISKWRSMTSVEQRELDGTMTGDFRNGPVHIRIKASAIRNAKAGSA